MKIAKELLYPAPFYNFLSYISDSDIDGIENCCIRFFPPVSNACPGHDLRYSFCETFCQGHLNKDNGFPGKQPMVQCKTPAVLSETPSPR